MAIESLLDPTPVPPCGNCGAELAIKTCLRAFVFDEFFELTEDVKNGNVNRATCPHCHYDGWLWPGFLIVNRKRAMGVFVDLRETERSFELQRALDGVRPFLSSESHAALSNRVLTVHNYQHVYELLCESDEFIEFELVQSRALEARRSIADLDDRARQWLADSIKAGVFSLQGDESDPDFLAAVVRTIDVTLSDTSAPEKLRSVLGRLLHELGRGLGQPPRSTLPKMTERPALSHDDFAEEEVRDGIVLDPPRELRAELQRLADALPILLPRIDGSAEPDESLSFYISALRILSEPSPPQTSAAGHQAISVPPDLAKLVPTVEVAGTTRTQPLLEALREGVNGRVDLLITTASVAISFVQRIRPI